MTIAALLRGIAQGERRAFETLYLEMQRPMLAYAIGLLAGDRSAAEDAVDEAFMDIWQSAGSFTGMGSGEGWVRRIVRNKAIDWLRRQRAARTEAWTHLHDYLPDDAVGPEGAALSADAAQWLRGALSALSVEQREVVILCYFEERPLTEIAAIAGCPLGTVKTRLFHARAILRRMLDLAEV